MSLSDMAGHGRTPGELRGFGNMGGAFGLWFPALNFGAGLAICASLAMLRFFALLTPSLFLVTAYLAGEIPVLDGLAAGSARAPRPGCAQ